MSAHRIGSLLLRGLATLLAVVVVLALVTVGWLRHENRPATGDVQVDGLRAGVQVTRDQWGIPHIRATSDEDAVFALGFVHWQDRAWQMEFQRRIAAGRLAEVLGSAAVESDRLLRTMGFHRVAAQALPALQPRTRGLVSAYTAGVNAAMGHTAPAPEFRILGITPEPWTDVDAVSWSQLMSLDLATNYVDEIAASRAFGRAGQAGIEALYPPVTSDMPTILSTADLRQAAARRGPVDTPAARAEATAVAEAGAASVRAVTELGMAPAPGKGSNNWVLDGTHTRGGKPLLANDPHLALNSPMLWYLADVQGENLRAIGASIPGLPAIVIGRTASFAWGVTNVGADVQDLYVEPEGTPLASRQEVIRVKGGADVPITVRSSRHGPIVSDVGVSDSPEVAGAKGAPRTLALRWVALDPGDTTMDAFVGLNYAHTVDDAVKALKRYVSPSQNFVLADTSGSTGYVAPGKLPIRTWEGNLPVPGDGSHEWRGYVEFDDTPHVVDPPEGRIVTANNNVVPLDSDAPVLAGPRVWADPYRAQRILDLLEEREHDAGGRGLGPDDMAAMQVDVRSGPWLDLRERLLATEPRDDLGRAALDRLRAWDGVESGDSVEAAIFEAWLFRLRGLATDELGEHMRTHSRAVSSQLDQGVFCPDAATGETTCAQALSRTLQQTTSDLAARRGPIERWTWGSVHHSVHDHGAFAGIPVLGRVFSYSIATDGGTDTVDPARPDNTRLDNRNGPGYRQIVDLADPDASRFLGSLGQGGSPFHPHANDMLPRWRDGEYVPMSTREQDWGAVEHLTLRPGT